MEKYKNEIKVLKAISHPARLAFWKFYAMVNSASVTWKPFWGCVRRISPNS